MEQLADLGKALAKLRCIWGLSTHECATRLGVPVERLAASEEGYIDADTLERMAALYALDGEELQRGTIMPVTGVGGSTVFLLQGPYQDFNAQDLGAIERAMRAARAMTALRAAEGESDPLSRRVQFTPRPPAGPRPRDAAQQGYKLARHVRAKLGLDGKPIEDMGDLLEGHLGIAILVDELASAGLRAASVLDAHRAAAAIVLSAEDADRERNPTLARVYLAHELCHLLFDPGFPDSVRLALDDRPSDGSSSKKEGSKIDLLLESRAKGFAAEFLIPLEGVRTLLGAAGASASSLGSARAMVAKVRDHFGTPWEIATRYLSNLGFLKPELTFDLLGKPEPTRVHHATSLPPPKSSHWVFKELAPNRYHRDPTVADPPPAVSDEMREPPPYVAQARAAVDESLDARSRRVLEEAMRASEREIEAIDMLVGHFDELFLVGEFDAARRALAMLDVDRLPPKALTAVLMVSRHAREQLGDARSVFFERVRLALEETWQVAPDAVRAIERRLL